MNKPEGWHQTQPCKNGKKEVSKFLHFDFQMSHRCRVAVWKRTENKKESIAREHKPKTNPTKKKRRENTYKETATQKQGKGKAGANKHQRRLLLQLLLSHYCQDYQYNSITIIIQDYHYVQVFE